MNFNFGLKNLSGLVNQQYFKSELQQNNINGGKKKKISSFMQFLKKRKRYLHQKKKLFNTPPQLH